MTDTQATINSKGLDGTGITEDIAAELFHKVGTHVMAIVDLQVVDKHGPSVKGKRKVTLVIDGIEPALDDTLAEHLRELQRTVYLNRKHADGQLAIDQELTGDEPTVEGVVAAGAAHRPHPFLPVDASEDNPICDVCGLLEAAARHSVQDLLPDDGDDDQAGAGEAVNEETGEVTEPGEPLPDATDAEPWEYDRPEGTRQPSTVPDPFAAPDPDPSPAA
ncbi:hypothetical protein GON03_19175 [Nocardioides sp. MAH-18]|uniref:Uncharacterized protein n=1 Tax=Nocardioides agri TaxID=2682843 RepID=A0A6L6XW71_9ACTN|nr:MULTISPECIES: hypothetical protein [unclassified Nocardioides]MBA2952140.1 hypothetical protein [Nocardioides sp. CGMCC 1.13656]MVQ51308.1 hypothetical protein [Nocardioides sp. MAH-18]